MGELTWSTMRQRIGERKAEVAGTDYNPVLMQLVDVEPEEAYRRGKVAGLEDAIQVLWVLTRPPRPGTAAEGGGGG